MRALQETCALLRQARLSLVIVQFVWHPIAACLWGLTRRRINRFKYGRFSIFHQSFTSKMSFTANYAHRRVQATLENHRAQTAQHWAQHRSIAAQLNYETHGFNRVSRHISRKINLAPLPLQSSINFCAIIQVLVRGTASRVPLWSFACKNEWPSIFLQSIRLW